MTHVHVLSGGESSEREVSLRSGSAVAAALATAGYDVTVLDPKTSRLDEIIDCDVVFPVLHGAGGEDGILQAKLEAAGVPFVGSGSKASALCFDKWLYRQAVTAAGLPMAAGALVTADSYADHELYRYPFVIKPLNGGSSIDTYIVRDIGNPPNQQLLDSFGRYSTMLLEQLIEDTEITVGILEGQALPVIEIVPPSDGEFDYENKYNGKTQELCPPQNVSAKVQRMAQQLALQAHQLTGCQGLSRTDMIVDNQDGLWLLETNTIPGMTDQSLFPKMAAAAGITMPALCRRLIDQSFNR